jgi:hypothetical protein
MVGGLGWVKLEGKGVALGGDFQKEGKYRS